MYVRSAAMDEALDIDDETQRSSGQDSALGEDQFTYD